LEGAMNIAIAYDQAYRSARTEGHKFSRRSDSERKNQGQRQTNGVTRVVTKELEAISKTTYPRRSSKEWEQCKREGRCFRCKELGHMGIHCRKYPGPTPAKREATVNIIERDSGNEDSQ
jgi:hypothetical protein